MNGPSETPAADRSPSVCPECRGDGYIEDEFSPTDPDPRLAGGVRIPCLHCDGTGHLPTAPAGGRRRMNSRRRRS